MYMSSYIYKESQGKAWHPMGSQRWGHYLFCEPVKGVST